MRPRIVLADDHVLLLDGLRRLLEHEFDLVALVQDGRALISAVEKFKPDLAVCDISMPLLNGLDAMRQCRQKDSRTKFVFVTGNGDVALATKAFRLGASGYVMKYSAVEELQVAIREVLHGRTYITPRIAHQVLQDLMHPSPVDPANGSRLSIREREVLQLLAEGRTMKEAAAAMRISPRTVEFHKNNIMEKTGLRTTAELARFAVRSGIIPENQALFPD